MFICTHLHAKCMYLTVIAPLRTCTHSMYVHTHTCIQLYICTYMEVMSFHILNTHTHIHRKEAMSFVHLRQVGSELQVSSILKIVCNQSETSNSEVTQGDRKGNSLDVIKSNEVT